MSGSGESSCWRWILDSWSWPSDLLTTFSMNRLVLIPSLSSLTSLISLFLSLMLQECWCFCWICWIWTLLLPRDSFVLWSSRWWLHHVRSLPSSIPHPHSYLTSRLFSSSFMKTIKERLTEGGASGAFFFFTKDEKFIAKSCTLDEIAHIRRSSLMLSKYFQENPESFITRVGPSLSSSLPSDLSLLPPDRSMVLTNWESMGHHFISLSQIIFSWIQMMKWSMRSMTSKDLGSRGIQLHHKLDKESLAHIAIRNISSWGRRDKSRNLISTVLPPPLLAPSWPDLTWPLSDPLGCWSSQGQQIICRPQKKRMIQVVVRCKSLVIMNQMWSWRITIWNIRYDSQGSLQNSCYIN
jgi:hypothetical protein